MSLALLQTSSEKPTLNQLKRAFRAWPDLRDLDAVTSFNDAYGIILRGLEEQEALALQESLAREEVPAQIVAEAELPVLPLGHAVVKLEFNPSYFEATDPLDRAFKVAWDQVLLVAAGQIAPSPLTRPRRASEDKTEISNAPEDRVHRVADLFLIGGTERFTMDADRFDFSYLAQRRTGEAGKDLAYLVQDIVQFAPGAGLSRGAMRFCEQPSSAHTYPRKSAYAEEIVWMLWLSSQANSP